MGEARHLEGADDVDGLVGELGTGEEGVTGGQVGEPDRRQPQPGQLADGQRAFGMVVQDEPTARGAFQVAQGVAGEVGVGVPVQSRQDRGVGGGGVRQQLRPGEQTGQMLGLAAGTRERGLSGGLGNTDDEGSAARRAGGPPSGVVQGPQSRRVRGDHPVQGAGSGVGVSRGRRVRGQRAQEAAGRSPHTGPARQARGRDHGAQQRGLNPSSAPRATRC